MVEQVRQGKPVEAVPAFQFVQRLFQPQPALGPDPHHAGPAAGRRIVREFLSTDPLQPDVLHEHGAVIRPVAPDIVRSACDLRLVDQGVDDNDDFAVMLKQVLQDVRPEQEVAVNNHHVVAELVPGAGQGIKFSRGFVTGIQAHVDPVQVQGFRLVAGDHRDVVHGVLFEFVDQSLQQGFAADVQHGLGPVLGQFVQVVAPARGQDQRAAFPGGVQVAFLRPQQFVSAL